MSKHSLMIMISEMNTDLFSITKSVWDTIV